MKKMYASFFKENIKTFGNIQLLYDSIVKDLETETPFFYRTKNNSSIRSLYPSTYSRFQKQIRKSKSFMVYSDIDKTKTISVYNATYNKL